LAVEQPGKQSRAKRVAGADWVDFRNWVTWAKAAFCPLSAPGAKRLSGDRESWIHGRGGGDKRGVNHKQTAHSGADNY